MREAILRTILSDGSLGWRAFRAPLRTLTAHSLDQVPGIIAAAEAEGAQGRICVGFVAYEAAPAFDPALSVSGAACGLPLAQFSVFEGFEELRELPDAPNAQDGPAIEWRPEIDECSYREALAKIKTYIGDGDTYQTNYTFRLRSNSQADARRLFGGLSVCPRTAFSAYIESEAFAICSASPELFFELEGDRIVSKPMKGTAPRGPLSADDERAAAALQHSEKNRAENLMIVDMARNDLGRIAEVGSVRTADLFKVERYATVHQMTSTVSAVTQASVLDIFRALFPAASVTGAPKKRTMEIIRELEASPRGVYTGCIGTIGPGRRARFNVAIRTAVLDRTKGRWEYGVGGGIVWDSTADGEYEECRTKAEVLRGGSEPFELLETLKWTPSEGYELLDRHVDRLMDSARYFDFAADEASVLEALAEASRGFHGGPAAVRLTVDRTGRCSIASAPLRTWPSGRDVRLGLASSPVDASDRFLYHKTTRRAIYEAARAERPDLDEVILWNREGFASEGTFTNLAAMIGGRLVTPPVACGLLPGTLRAQMLEDGALHEALIRVEDLTGAEAIYILNSVRGMAKGVLAEASTKVSTAL